MYDSLFVRQIRRANRNLLLTNALIVLGVVAVLVLSYRYLYNVYAGPFELPADELFSLSDPDQRTQYYVTVEADDAVPTGFQEITQQVDKYSKKVKSEQVSAEYLAALIDNRVMLVKAEPADLGPRFSGALSTLDADEQGFVREMQREMPELGKQGLMSPLLLDAERDFRTPGYLETAVMLPLLLLGLWNIFKGARRLSDPAAHPALRQLERYGMAREVAAGIDSEVAAGAGVARIGPVTLTRNWLLAESRYGLRAMRLDELVWIYQKVTQRRVNFIPAGKTFAAVIVGAQGAPLELPLKQPEAQSLLLEIAGRVPWVLAGYDQQLEQLWKKDRGQLIQAVGERRSQTMSQANQSWSS